MALNVGIVWHGILELFTLDAVGWVGDENVAPVKASTW